MFNLRSMFKATGNTLTVIPLMIVPMGLYWFWAWIGSVDSGLVSWATASGDVTHFSVGQFIVANALVFLALEMVKATSTGTRGSLDQVMSVALLCASLMAYALLGGFGTSTFLTLVLMQALDVVAGFIVSIKVARRDIGFGG